MSDDFNKDVQGIAKQIDEVSQKLEQGRSQKHGWERLHRSTLPMGMAWVQDLQQVIFHESARLHTK